MIVHLENANDFEKEVQGELVIVDFYADWCGPCQMLAPVLEQLDGELPVKIVKINTDFVPEVARMFRVMSIPTLLLFKDGKFVKRDLGYMPIERLREFIK
ncbi:MAG: thioredoxin [Bacilli bacterium]|nr:thioredoxin [Bacilli bacterium]